MAKKGYSSRLLCAPTTNPMFRAISYCFLLFVELMIILLYCFVIINLSFMQYELLVCPVVVQQSYVTRGKCAAVSQLTTVVHSMAMVKETFGQHSAQSPTFPLLASLRFGTLLHVLCREQPPPLSVEKCCSSEAVVHPQENFGLNLPETVDFLFALSL